MRHERPYDWFKFWVHFACGMAVGAFVGVRLLACSHFAASPSVWPAFGFIGLSAAAVGLFAGIISHTGWDEHIH